MGTAYEEIVMGMLAMTPHRHCERSEAIQNQTSTLMKRLHQSGLVLLSRTYGGLVLDCFASLAMTSKPEHMVERKPSHAVIHAMKAKQPAGGVADQHISRRPRRANLAGRKIIRRINQRRA